MFRANQSGYNTLQNKVLNTAKIQTNVEPFGSEVDIGTSQNKFKRIFVAENYADQLYSTTISTGNLYSVLADLEDADMTRATIGSAVVSNGKFTNITSGNVIRTVRIESTSRAFSPNSSKMENNPSLIFGANR